MIRYIFLLSFLLFFSCDNRTYVAPEDPAKGPDVRIYGEVSCGNCQYLKEELEDMNIPFTFYNLEGEERRENEKNLKRVLNTINHEGAIVMPVVKLYDTVLMNPKGDIIWNIIQDHEQKQTQQNDLSFE